MFYHAQIIKNADPASFKPVGHFYSMDRNHVYYGARSLMLNIAEVIFIDDAYVTDSQSIYFLGDKLPNADPTSFRHLDYNFAKDSNQVYYREKVILDADAKSFEVLSYTEFKDKKYRYFINQGEVQRELLQPPYLKLVR